MSTSIATDQNISTGKRAEPPTPRWHLYLTWGLVLALVIIALAMRLYNLGKPFDYDGYDEGVYWQSLRAMSAGYTLYRQIFYSQPPLFLLFTYPFYVLFGSSIWSARLGIALISLLGLPGAYVIGKSLSGRVGAIAAMVLLIADPLYLAQSQKLQAEVSATAFSLLAVGAAYMWWKQPDSRRGLWMAILCGITLPVGILCKLLSVTALVPIGLLILARLWQIWRKQPGTSSRSLRPILIAIVVCIVVSLIALIPYLGSLHPLIQQVVSFHLAAKTALIGEEVANKATLQSFLLSNTALVVAAAVGASIALLRRDWRIIPLAAWFLATFFVLLIQVPLFYRHAIALTPSMIAMAVIGIGDIAAIKKAASNYGEAITKVAALVILLLILLVVITNISPVRGYYQSISTQAADSYTQSQGQLANDLQKVTTPNQEVITDGQFVAARAGRSVPPFLVDTSMVRIDSGYLTAQQLIEAASQPQVHAVLFFSNRLTISQVASFHAWVAQHFHLYRNYGSGVELWIR
jgi:4-amino-4-deoxy-L-arabinose transferase-like glycosyltransferase